MSLLLLPMHCKSSFALRLKVTHNNAKPCIITIIKQQTREHECYLPNGELTPACRMRDTHGKVRHHRAICEKSAAANESEDSGCWVVECTLLMNDKRSEGMLLRTFGMGEITIRTITIVVVIIVIIIITYIITITTTTTTTTNTTTTTTTTPPPQL
jgi:hypothetical protein